MRQQKQMPTLRGIEFEYSRKIIQKIRRDANLSPLLQPCIPSKTDASECGNFLAPQTRRAPTFCSRQSDIFRRQPLTARAQKVGKIVPGSVENSHDQPIADCNSIIS